MPTQYSSSSAPGVLVGPNSYSKFVAEVISVKKVNLRIADSDVSTQPPKDYWEVTMKIVASEVLDADTGKKTSTKC